MDKKSLRKEMINTLKTIEENKRAKDEETLNNALIDYVKENNYKSIGLIISMPHEINTNESIDTFNALGIGVYSPACNYETKQMHFYKMNSSDDKKVDEKGIPVPNDTSESYDDLELLVVPGLLFNKQGYRIGYGGGYYDKFLSSFKGDTVSIIFDEQLGQDIPTELHDIPVDTLITPTTRISSKELRMNE